MSFILLSSIAIRLVAVVWSMSLLRHFTDWRIGFLTCMLGLMALRQVFTLTAAPMSWSLHLTSFMTEIPGLLVSIMALLAVFFLDRFLRKLKRTEEGIQANEAQWRTMADAVGAALFIYSGTRVLYVNAAAEAISGYRRDELLRMPFWEILHPTYRELVQKRGLARQQGEPVPSRYVVQIVTKQGEERWMDYTGTPLVFHGQPTVLATAFDITERVRAEEQVRESEGRFRTLVEHSLAGIYIFQNGALQYVNPKLAEIFGYTTDELLTHCHDGQGLVAEEELPRIRSIMREGLRGHEASIDYTFRGKRKDGMQIDIESHGVGIDYQGKPAIIGTLLDITERKRLEDTLLNISKGVSSATGERFFRSLVQYLAQSLEADYAVIGEILSDPIECVQTIAVYGNGIFMENFTYALAHTPCANVVDRQPCTYPQGVQQLFPADTLLAQMEAEGYAGAPLFDSTGRALGILVILSRQPIRSPRFVESILQIFAVRATAELERKQAEEQMRFQAQLLDNVRESIVATDLEGRITYWSKGAEELYGYAAEDVRGREIMLIVDSPEERVEELQRMQMVRDTGSWRGEYVQRRQGGSQFWADTVIALVKDPQGQPCGFVGIDRDITERRRLEEQLRQAQKMEAIGTLAGGIAHDFNNILAAILGYTELALYDLPNHSMSWQNLQEVIRAGHRAKNLVQQILTFSRQQSHELKPVLLHLLVKEVLSFLRASLPSTIDVRQHLDTNAGMILADATQIHQVLMNLCANAEHAMRNTGGVLAVGVDAVEIDTAMVARHPELQQGPYVRLTVRDTGHGMEPEAVERIFEPFFSTKGVGEGTGMGLAVVHGIVTSHNGVITRHYRE